MSAYQVDASEIVEKLKEKFPEYDCISDLLDERIDRVIESFQKGTLQFDRKTFRKYYSLRNDDIEDQSLRLLVRNFLWGMHLLIFEKYLGIKPLTQKDFEDIYYPIEEYRKAPKDHAADIQYMILFHHYLSVLHKITPKADHQYLLTLSLQVASRMEGSGEVYISGSRQRDAVTRREIIFRTVFGVSKTCRKKKDSDSDTDVESIHEASPVKKPRNRARTVATLTNESHFQNQKVLKTAKRQNGSKIRSNQRRSAKSSDRRSIKTSSPSNSIENRDISIGGRSMSIGTDSEESAGLDADLESETTMSADCCLMDIDNPDWEETSDI